MSALCFLDTETTGLHPKREVWEIAIIRRELDGAVTEWHRFVQVSLRHADPFGLNVGRFYERSPQGRMVRGEIDEGEAYGGSVDERPLVKWEYARAVARLTHGAHLVGAVPNFDAEVLARDLRQCGLTPSWHYHLIDVENLAAGFLAATYQDMRDRAASLVGKDDELYSADEALRSIRPPWGSEDLSNRLGIHPPGPKERHTALGDARWAMRIYDAVMGS
jgi:DNA polymerase III epsilon subunit-like protein